MIRAFCILFQIVIFPVHGCRCPLHISQFAGHFLFQHREKRGSTEHHIDKKSRYSSVTYSKTPVVVWYFLAFTLRYFNRLHVHEDNCMNLFSSLLNVPPNSLH